MVVFGYISIDCCELELRLVRVFGFGLIKRFVFGFNGGICLVVLGFIKLNLSCC